MGDRGRTRSGECCRIKFTMRAAENVAENVAATFSMLGALGMGDSVASTHDCLLLKLAVGEEALHFKLPFVTMSRVLLGEPEGGVEQVCGHIRARLPEHKPKRMANSPLSVLCSPSVLGIVLSCGLLGILGSDGSRCHGVACTQACALPQRGICEHRLEK